MVARDFMVQYICYNFLKLIAHWLKKYCKLKSAGKGLNFMALRASRVAFAFLNFVLSRWDLRIILGSICILCIVSSLCGMPLAMSILNSICIACIGVVCWAFRHGIIVITGSICILCSVLPFVGHSWHYGQFSTSAA